MAQSSKGPTEKIKIGPKKKIAFVCSGGATKAGAFHLGVALALREKGFKFFGGVQEPGKKSPTPGKMEISAYVGSSAGSVISSYLAAGYSLDNIFNSFTGREPQDEVDQIPKILPSLSYPKMLKFRPELATESLKQVLTIRKIVSGLLHGDFEALFQLKWIKAKGLFSTAGVEQFLREEVLPSNRFQDYLADLFIIATQLNHSRKVVFGKYKYEPPPSDLTCQYSNDATVAEACAASTALPFIYAPFSIKDKAGQSFDYIDGEIRDTLSTHVAIDGGADLVFASYTHQPYHYPLDMGSLADHGLPAILIQSIYLVIEQKIHNHIHNKEIQRNAITAVSKYCKQQGVSEEHRKKIVEILEGQLYHRMNVDTIYIHPNPTDSHLFFGEHFTLSSKKLADIVRSGFRAGIDALKRYEFADLKPS